MILILACPIPVFSWRRPIKKCCELIAYTVLLTKLYLEMHKCMPYKETQRSAYYRIRFTEISLVLSRSLCFCLQRSVHIMPKRSSWGTKRRLSDAQKAHLARLPTHLPRVSCNSHRHPSEAVQEPAFVANNTQEPARKVHTDTKIRNIRRRERWAKSRALMLDTKIHVLTVTAQKERCDLELKLKSALADSQASQAVLFLAETQNDQLKSLLDASETRVLHLEDMLALNQS